MKAERFFDAIARRYDRVYAPDARVSRERMDRVLRELHGRSRVLDLGVGTGRELSALQDAGHEVTGLDVSQEMLAICARRARPVPLVRADFYDPLGWEDASFDAILALHGTLAHAPALASLEALVREIHRVLAPGGVFVAEVPSPAWIDEAVRHVGDDGRSFRVEGGRAYFEDQVAGASIDVLLPSMEQWRLLFEVGFDVRTEPLREGEILLVGVRKGPLLA